MPAAGIAAITARRAVLAIPEVIVELALQGAPVHHLGQLAQQPALPGQLHPAGAGPLGELAQQPLISRGQPGPPLVLALRHVSHWYLLHLRSYTEITVPPHALLSTVSCQR